MVKFYTPVELPQQKLLIQQVYELISQRNSEFQSSFLTTPPSLVHAGSDELSDDQDIQVIYKNYATLYFTFIVDDQESELAILDLIQTFVESLDRCFAEVNELDLIFNWQTLESVLEEIVQGGMVIETSVAKIVSAVDQLNRSSSGDNRAGRFAGAGLGNALQSIVQAGFSGWGANQ